MASIYKPGKVVGPMGGASNILTFGAAA